MSILKQLFKKKEDDWLGVLSWADKDLTDEEKVKRGHKAQALLRDDTFREVMVALHRVLHSQIDSMQQKDNESVIMLSDQLRALRGIKGRLESWSQETERLKKS